MQAPAERCRVYFGASTVRVTPPVPPPPETSDLPAADPAPDTPGAGGSSGDASAAASELQVRAETREGAPVDAEPAWLSRRRVR